MESTQVEQQKEKEDELRAFCDHIKHTNVHSIGIPVEEKEERGREHM